jgi:hypothetical protein
MMLILLKMSRSARALREVRAIAGQPRREDFRIATRPCTEVPGFPAGRERHAVARRHVGGAPGRLRDGLLTLSEWSACAQGSSVTFCNQLLQVTKGDCRETAQEPGRPDIGGGLLPAAAQGFAKQSNQGYAR